MIIEDLRIQNCDHFIYKDFDLEFAKINLLTGLPNSGKTLIINKIYEELNKRQNKNQERYRYEFPYHERNLSSYDDYPREWENEPKNLKTLQKYFKIDLNMCLNNIRFKLLLNCCLYMLETQNQILFIDKPEKGLHPIVQNGVVNLLSAVANNNNQIFIETHSEHILNGFRVNVKKNIINDSDIEIFWVDGIEKYVNTYIKIDKEGRINIWPDYFFDQHGEDLTQLVGF